MKILKSSKDLTPMEVYQMTKSPEITTAKNLADGEIITVQCWCFYSDVNSKGEPIELLSMMDENNQVYAVQSDTFKQSFEDCLDIQRECGIESSKPLTIKKITGTAKSGREYINCVLVAME